MQMMTRGVLSALEKCAPNNKNAKTTNIILKAMRIPWFIRLFYRSIWRKRADTPQESPFFASAVSIHRTDGTELKWDGCTSSGGLRSAWFPSPASSWEPDNNVRCTWRMSVFPPDRGSNPVWSRHNPWGIDNFHTVVSRSHEKNDNRG